MRIQYNKVMKVKKLKNCVQFIGGDDSILREILNPKKEKLKVRYSLAHAKVKPGKRTLKHRLKYTEVYFILKGSGIMHINEEEMRVNKYDTILIPPNSIQYIENKGRKNLEFLCIVDPAWEPRCEEILES